MAETNNYRMGYTDAVIKFMAVRTAATEASLLLPHLKPTDKLLDLGCGPGSITVGFAPLVASVTAMDISEHSLALVRKSMEQMQADKTLSPADAAKVKTLLADLLAPQGLPFADETFDVIYASQTFVHLTGPGQAAKAMKEARRVLKPDGIMATRDAAETFCYPRHYDLWGVWIKKMNMALLGHDARYLANGRPQGPDMMPKLYRESGFQVSKIKVNSGWPWVWSGREAREWCFDNWLAKADEPSLKQKWEAAGVTREDVHLAREIVEKWRDDDDAWAMVTHCDIVGFK